MDKYRVCAVQPPDATTEAINQITSDLRRALMQAQHEGEIESRVFWGAWNIVDNWQGALHQRADHAWALVNDPNYQTVRELKYVEGMEIPLR